ncbi:MAG TPA: hypothetical protein VN493_27785 [Thermoanaerobaculia bacterium]|nr:hypothetical protein [Thermoanaerobaculia bacterium]
MLRRGGTRLARALVLTLLLGSLWSRLALWMEMLNPWRAVTAAACDDGASIDPNGCPRPQGVDQPTPAGDDGAHIDPNG